MEIPGIVKTFDLKDGRTISMETGKLAKQADGSVVVSMGKAKIMCTVVSAAEPKPGMGFFPLTVEYKEKFSAAGRIPGGFFKREGRANENEILVARLVDRAIRPLFADNYMNETQVIINLISSDPEVQPDALAALAASTALSLSDIPWAGPISEVRIARINGEFKVNPPISEMENADLDIILAATEKDVMMVEGEMLEVSEDDLIQAINVGHEAIREQCKAQHELVEMAGGKKEQREVGQPEENEEIKALVATKRDAIYEVAKGALTKPERKAGFKEVLDSILETFNEEDENYEELQGFAKTYFSKLEKEVVRNMMIDDRVRLDGRGTEEVRPIWIEMDYLPAAHGSAVFTRGETQSLTSVTLGTKDDEQMLDKVSGIEFSKFMLHYNFPPFSTGEAKPLRGTSRREVGHGNLALRSIKNVLPTGDDNPYTVRVVSDILESNGSSSMATVCAASLALMDAGVQVREGVSGIAMGLVSREDGKYAILSDILGDEDHLGDMDFKVTGTKKGICACQMDIKIDGLSNELLKEALEQSKRGRLHILEKMNEVIDTPRAELKPHVPRIERVMIDKEFIGAIIGPGGKIIQEMQAETNTKITITEIDDQGEVLIASANKDDIEAAKAKIKAIVAVPEEGEVYEAKVQSIMPYGAFVEFLPGKSGLLHISEISWTRLENMDGVFSEGDTVKVKLMGID